MVSPTKFPLFPSVVFSLLQAIFISQVDTLEYDEAIYMDVARNIRQTGVAWRSMGDNILYAEHTSLYQHLIGFLTLFIGENIFLLRLFTVLMAIGCLFLTYFLVFNLTQNHLNSLFATLLLAVNPFFNLYAYFIREEMLMCLFVLGSSYSFLIYQQKEKIGYLWLAAGLLAGAVLTKEISLIFGGICGIFILFRPVSWLQKFKEGLVLATPAGLSLLWWGFWVSWHAPLLLQAILSRWLASASLTGGGTDFRTGLTAGQWGQILSLEVYSVGFITAGLSILLLALWQRPKIPPFLGLCLGYVGVALLLSFFFSLKEPRHLMATIPLAAVAFGSLPRLTPLLEWIKKSKARFMATAGLSLLVLSHSSLWQLPSFGQPPDPVWNHRVAHRLFVEPPYYQLLRTAGLYLNQHTPPTAKIAVVHQATVVGYYADRNYVGLYGSNLEGVFTLLDQVAYLVYDHPVFVQLSPEEIEAVNQYIAEHFLLLETIQDESRTISIYQRQ